MKFPWTMIAVMATVSFLSFTTPLVASASTSAFEDSWNIHTESVVRGRLSKMDLPFEAANTDLVISRIKSYVTAGRKETEAILGRTILYFPIFEHYLDVYKLPRELKYLPMIESGLRPYIGSKAGAVGMWQFMNITARHYGLTVNDYVDERRDPYRSSEGAARMLADLYRMFGDWSLVLAAYNAGPGRIQQAIRQSQCSDYAEVRKRLPSETQRYLPTLIAMAYVANYYQDHGLQPKLPSFELQQTRTIRVKQSISFRDIARLTGVDRNTLATLNPGYLQEYIPQNKRGYFLILPANAVSKLKAHLMAKTPPSADIPANAFKYSHVVEAGDDIQKLARLFQVSVEDIVRWNDLALPEIVVNQELDLYLSRAFVFSRA